MATESFISADSHVVEPADLWTTRMDRKFRDRAPHFERGAHGDHWVVEGLNSLPIGLFGPMVSEKAQGGIDARGQERHHEETRPARIIRPQPTRRSRNRLSRRLPDPVRNSRRRVSARMYRVYNDWLAQFCGGDPKRLVGSGIVPMRGPVEWAIAEAERCAKTGLRS